MAAERVVCGQCGANNFATQAACWKCGKSLAAGGGAATSPSPAAAVVLPSAPVQAHSPAALWSSIAMGFFFPMIAIPAGLIFLMLDDRRKAQIGWWNLIAGTVGTVIHLLVTFATIWPAVRATQSLIPRLAQPQESTDPNREVPPLNLPGSQPFSTPPR